MSREVQQMFARIAGRYDLANDVLSLGIHRFWRRQAVKLSGIGRGAEVLDLCAGTGDQSFSLADTVGREGSVIGLDFVMPMLTLAAAKNGRFSERKVGRAPVTFLQGDAMTLPFADGAFDLVTISFGIRNVDSPVKCLQEIYRVLRPGGRVMVLEFGRPQISWLRYCYDLYSRWIMPTLGGLLSGDRSAYEYLPRTAAVFPDASNFLELMQQANFDCLRYRAFLTGIAFAYYGERLDEHKLAGVNSRHYVSG